MKKHNTNISVELPSGVIWWSKLTGKPWEASNRLRAVKTNLQKLSSPIRPDYKAQAQRVLNQVQDIIKEILAVPLPETAQNPPQHRDWESDQLFAKTQPHQ